MKQVRMEARIRNNILWHAIYETWKSVAEFCRKKKLDPQCVGEFLNLRRRPFDEFGNYTTLANSCSDALGKEPEELFPPQLYQKLAGEKLVREYSFAELPEAEAQLQLLSASDDPFEGVSADELTRDLRACLTTLTPREMESIRSYYGIGCEQKTMEKISVDLGVAVSRVRQFIRSGLLKLGAPPKTYDERKRVLGYGHLRHQNLGRLRSFLGI